MLKPIALQLYTLREQMTQDWVGTLERVANAGYVGVETAGFAYAPSVESVIEKLDQLNLQIVAAHSGLPSTNADDPIYQTMQLLGANRLICASTGRDKFSNRSDILEQARKFNAVNDIAKQQNLQFGLHNHGWEFQIINGQYGYDILLEQLDPSIFLELDVYWMQSMGVDVVSYIRKMGERAKLLHIKDGPGTPEGMHVAVGKGEIDIAACIEAGVSAEWLIVELDHSDGDMMLAVEESARFLIENKLARGN